MFQILFQNLLCICLAVGNNSYDIDTMRQIVDIEVAVVRIETP